MRRTGGIPRQRVAAAGALAVLLLAGCLPSSGGSSGSDAAPTDGGWVLQASASCTQHLVLDAEGTFALAARLEAADGWMERALHGTLQQTDGGTRLRFLPAEALTAQDWVYCAQWEGGAQRALDWTGALTDGVDPEALRFHPAAALGSGVLWIGVDDAARERVVLFRAPPEEDALPEEAAGTLRALNLDDVAEADPWQRLPEEDPVRALTAHAGQAVWPMPGTQLRLELSASGEGQVLKTLLLLNAIAPARLQVTAEGAACAVVHLLSPDADAGLGELGTVAAADSAVVTLLPGTTGNGLVSVDVSTSEGAGTASLLPLQIRSLQAGSCTVSLRAEPLAAQVVRSWLDAQESALQPRVTAPVLEGLAASALLAARDADGRLHPLSLELPGLPARGLALAPLLLYPRSLVPLDGSETLDPLHLADPRNGWRRVSARHGATGPRLNLFPSASAETGLGPFRHPEASGPLLSVPGAVQVDVPAGGEGALRVRIGQGGRVALFSDAPAQAVLRAADGLHWAAAPAGTHAGGGFLLRRTLPAGDYALRVRSVAGAALPELTVQGEPAGQGPVPDEALEACLLATGLEGSGITGLRRLPCAGRDVRSLAGLSAFTALEALDLAGNPLEDIADLEALTGLRSLSLAETGVWDLRAIEALPALRRLSLAGLDLDLSALLDLRNLLEGLADLELGSLEDWPEADRTALLQLLPQTVILTTEGVLE